MERFRRSSPSPSRHVTYDRKRPSIGRAAENLQCKFLASLLHVRRRGGDRLAQEKMSPFFAAFFRLPSELHIHILCSLSISDLLSLRRTCRALNDLINICGPAIVRFWVENRMGTLHVKLYPPPPPMGADLQYLLAMRRRHIASLRLTQELVRFVLRDNLRYTTDQQRKMWKSVCERMLSMAFTVGYFLEEHRRVILERDLGRIRPRSNIGYDICTTPGIIEQEREIVRSLDPPLRLQYFYMYCFMLQVLTRKLRPPTYTGKVEKLVRGWTRHPVCSEDIAFVLVLGGIGQVAKLLACKNYSERRRLLHTFITRLSPHESVNWRRHWRDLGVSSRALLDDIPCTSIGITQLDQIWEPVMTEMMRPESRDFTAHQKARYAEVRASKNYINELMGYDVLRGRPADGDNDDSDGDDGDEL